MKLTATIMNSFISSLVVAIAVLVPINAAERTSMQRVELNKLLNLLQSNKKYHESVSSEDSNSSNSDSSDHDYDRSGGSKTALLDIVRQIVQEKKYKDAENYREGKKRVTKNDYDKRNFDSYYSSDFAPLIESLLGKDLKSVDVKLLSTMRVPKKHLSPNRLLGDVKDSVNDQNSRIYLILNPDAMEKSKDRKSGVNKLISSLLSLSSSSLNKDRQVNKRQNIYKGFSVDENIKRRRGSRQMYMNDSGEEKPKRGRGGSGSGHTAIPYIQHRGENIYERD